MSSSVGRRTSRPGRSIPRSCASRTQRQVGNRHGGAQLHRPPRPRRRRLREPGRRRLHAVGQAERDQRLPGARAGEPLGSVVRHDPPVLDDRHAVGQPLRLLQVVRREQDRLPSPRSDSITSEASRRAAGSKPSSAHRGTAARVADQRHRHVQAAALAAREPLRPLVRLRLQPTSAIVSSTERGLGKCRRTGAAPRARSEGRRLGLLQHHADARPPPGARRAGSSPAPQPCRRRASGSPRGLDRRRFAGAVRTQESEQLARRISRSIPRTASTRPYDLRRSRTAIIGAGA